jgi:hypothetical protein
MAIAGIGTITCATNSTTVTGSSSSFTSYQRVTGNLYNSSGTLIGTIASIASDTSLTLTANAAVAVTAGSYNYTSPVIIASSSISLPVGNISNRGSALAGAIRYNSQRGGWEYSDGTEWLLPGQLVATGGTFSTAGGFSYHVFTSSGSFVVSAGSKVGEVLLVAGGGGGGYQVGGGGGAGGLVYNSAVNLTPGTYTVNIGGGGNGQNNARTSISMGGNSSFTNVTTAIGGGYGGDYASGANAASVTGGSGGGQGGSFGSNGAGTPGQGNPGGTWNGTNWAAGGGGGAGGAGSPSASPSIGGPGGVGLLYSQFSSWGTGNPQTYTTGGAAAPGGGWFAGGGGGCCNDGTSTDYNGGAGFSLGGAGGGGRGFQNNGQGLNGTTHGDDGAPNTGGGGGGVRDTYSGGPNYSRSGNGGSGICIVRYAS